MLLVRALCGTPRPRCDPGTSVPRSATAFRFSSEFLKIAGAIFIVWPYYISGYVDVQHRMLRSGHAIMAMIILQVLNNCARDTMRPAPPRPPAACMPAACACARRARGASCVLRPLPLSVYLAGRFPSFRTEYRVIQVVSLRKSGQLLRNLQRAARRWPAGGRAGWTGVRLGVTGRLPGTACGCCETTLSGAVRDRPGH